MTARRLAPLAFFAGVAACSPIQPIEQPVASANLIGADGTVAGVVRIHQQTTALLLRIDANGLAAGQHGVHIHETGRCDAPSFASAGAHWNPTGSQHGHQNLQGPHRGDLGNVGVGADGKLVAGLLVPGTSLHPGGPGATLHDSDGAALVIHARADDERTDPSGNSGERIACAVLIAAS